MNILPSIHRESVSFFEQSFLSTLTAQQKKVAAVALLAFACLVACYAFYYYARNWKAKASEEEKVKATEAPDEELKVPHEDEDPKETEAPDEELKVPHEDENPTEMEVPDEEPQASQEEPPVPQELPKINEEATVKCTDRLEVISKINYYLSLPPEKWQEGDEVVCKLSEFISNNRLLIARNNGIRPPADGITYRALKNALDQLSKCMELIPASKRGEGAFNKEDLQQKITYLKNNVAGTIDELLLPNYMIHKDIWFKDWTELTSTDLDALIEPYVLLGKAWVPDYT